MIKNITFIFSKIRKFTRSNDLELIFFFTLLTSFLEIFGLSAVGTFISAMTSNFDESNFLIDFIKKIFNTNSKNELLKITGYFVIFLFLIINIANAYLYSFITRKSNNYVSYLSTSLFDNYLRKNYFFFTQKSISRLTKNIINETHTVINQIIFPFFILISKLVTTVIVVIFLFFYNTEITLILFLILALSYFTLYFLFNQKLLRLGKKLIKENEKKYLIVQETLFGIKEIKLFNLKDITIKNFKYTLDKFYKYRTLSSLITVLPRYFIEVVIIVIFILFLINSFSDNTTDNIKDLSILSVFLVASSRLFPAFQNIYSSTSLIKNAFPNFDLILNELRSQENKDVISNKKNNLNFKNKIVLKNISLQYKKDEKFVFNKLNLEIKKNTTFGIKGASGKGKSTLVDIISGLVRPNFGEIIVDKKKINNRNLTSWRSKFSYVPQKVFLFDDTIMNNIILGNKINTNIKLSDLNFAIKASRLDKFINNKPSKLNFAIRGNGMNISGGQRQRIGIARCVYYNKDIIIFDEATSGLDKKTEKELLKIIFGLKTKKTIIIISHNKDIIKKCNNYIDLDNY